MLYSDLLAESTGNPPLRVEHDLLGDRQVPSDVYYGIHTLRALENFTISGISIGSLPDLVLALACVKQAAAVTNQHLGLLDPRRAAAIVGACEEIRAGHLHESFVVDVIQGGAGTSTNMNANEVIANRGLELLGHERGEYSFLHPLEHVNLGQSTNDVYPTALRLALHWAVGRLTVAMDELADAFAAKSVEFRGHLKIGRTQLQDAVPMTLGREFGSYAMMVREDVERLDDALRLITEINLGGTAIGTGLNAHPDYSRLACAELSDITGLSLTTAADLVEATQDVGAFVHLSGVLKRTAVKLSKICNDLRLLSSGPQAGFGEINLPAVQPGSSIMPGKVNPVIPEVVNQVAFEVVGNDMTITMAAEAGQLQLNAFEPIIAHSLFKSISHLTSACSLLSSRCVVGITPNVEQMRRSVESSIGLLTALSPHIGYGAASALAVEALTGTRSVSDLVLERGLLSKHELSHILRPEGLGCPATR